MSVYDLKRHMAASVSNFWTAAHSQVYQQASRLVRDGYAKQREIPGGRRKRVLSLTPKGRKAVVEWLRFPASVVELYSEVLVKVFFAHQAGDLEATRQMLESDRRRLIERLAGYEALMKRLENDERQRYPASTLDLGIRFHRLVIRWEDEVLAMLQEDLARERPI